MIESWGNRIAQELWETDKSSKLPRSCHTRAKWILEVMRASATVADVAAITQPQMLRPHLLKGDRRGEMAVDILGKTNPWRIVFTFRGGKFFNVKIENYH